MAGETRFTPGPWKAEPFLSDPMNFTIVAPGDVIVTHVTTGHVPDAYLIAALPDLYSALEACLEGGSFKHPQTRERALAAMARARGETP